MSSYRAPKTAVWVKRDRECDEMGTPSLGRTSENGCSDGGRSRGNGSADEQPLTTETVVRMERDQEVEPPIDQPEAERCGQSEARAVENSRLDGERSRAFPSSAPMRSGERLRGDGRSPMQRSRERSRVLWIRRDEERSRGDPGPSRMGKVGNLERD